MNIEINYTWDKDAFVKASMANMKYRFGGVKSIVVSVIIFVFFVATLYFVSKKGIEQFDYFFIFIAIYWFILRWPFYIWMFRRQFNQHTEKDADVSWVITEGGIKGVGSNSSGEFNWTSITDAIKSKHGYLIYRYPMFHWFPYSAFKSDGDKQIFQQLISKNVKNQKITSHSARTS